MPPDGARIGGWLAGLRGAALVALALVALILASRAGQPQLSAEVTWYGVYRTSQDTRIADASSASGDRVTSSGVIPPQTSDDHVAAAPGVRFGFGFALRGAPQGRIAPLRFVRRFPPPGLAVLGGDERRLREESGFAVRVGDPDAFVGYLLDRQQDMLPGEWTFEVWSGEARLAAKTFVVTTP